MRRLAASVLLTISIATASFASDSVLVILSEASSIVLQDGKEHNTGVFLSELAIPAMKLEKSGFQLVFATPTGKAATIDPASQSATYFHDEKAFVAAEKFLKDQPGFSKPLSLDGLETRDVKNIVALFIPGGFAPTADLAFNSDLGRVLRATHSDGKPIGLICHGPAALLSAKTWWRGWPFKNFKMTAFSEEEDGIAEAQALGGKLSYYVSKELSRLGGSVENGPAFKSNVRWDRNLVTGQNPQSGEAFADTLVEAIYKRRFESLSAERWSTELSALQEGLLYDHSPAKAGVSSGYVSFFVGSRKANVAAAGFLTRMARHVNLARKTLEPLGLRGYVFYATPDFEVAYLGWPDEKTATAAFASSTAKDLLQDAGSLMDTTVWKPTDAYPGIRVRP